MCRTTMSHTHTVPCGLVLANIPLLILHAPICLQCALLRQARQADSDGKLASTSIGIPPSAQGAAKDAVGVLPRRSSVGAVEAAAARAASADQAA